jgi:hypothetical protein
VLIKEQMALWGEPRVEIVIITTSGWFTTDAIQWIEKHNENGEVSLRDIKGGALGKLAPTLPVAAMRRGERLLSTHSGKSVLPFLGCGGPPQPCPSARAGRARSREGPSDAQRCLDALYRDEAEPRH